MVNRGYEEALWRCLDHPNARRRFGKLVKNKKDTGV
jgi:hypothetical protein